VDLVGAVGDGSHILCLHWCLCSVCRLIWLDCRYTISRGRPERHVSEMTYDALMGTMNHSVA